VFVCRAEHRASIVSIAALLARVLVRVIIIALLIVSVFILAGFLHVDIFAFASVSATQAIDQDTNGGESAKGVAIN